MYLTLRIHVPVKSVHHSFTAYCREVTLSLYEILQETRAQCDIHLASFLTQVVRYKLNYQDNKCVGKHLCVVVYPSFVRYQLNYQDNNCVGKQSCVVVYPSFMISNFKRRFGLIQTTIILCYSKASSLTESIRHSRDRSNFSYFFEQCNLIR